MAKKKKSNRLLRNLIIVVVILIVATFVARRVGLIGKSKAMEVTITKASKEEIVEKVTASGKVQPEAEVKISPDVSGEITEVLIEEGDSVVKGQLLLKIRPDNLEAAVESAAATVKSRRANVSQSEADYAQRKAQLLQSKNEYERNKELYEQKVISLADFQTAEANYLVAKEQAASAQKSIEAARFNLENSQALLQQNLDNLSRTNVYAPVSGTVSKLSVEKGEKVVGTATMAGTEMLIIADLNNMEVQVDVNENDIVKVRIGQKVIIDVDSYSSTGRKFDGLVTEIANTANETATADAVTEFEVKIRILNESYQDLIRKGSKLPPFRPGMTASVDIVTDRKEGIITVPIAAVTTRNATQNTNKKGSKQKATATQVKNTDAPAREENEIEEVVFVYNEETQTVEQRKVETGISDFENIEVTKGLKLGEQVVTGPFNLVSKQLKDGQKVAIKDENAKSTAKED